MLWPREMVNGPGDWNYDTLYEGGNHYILWFYKDSDYFDALTYHAVCKW